MENKTLPNQQNQQKQSNMRNYMILYLDIAIRGLIAFFVIGVVLAFILIGYFKMSYIWVLPISFLLSIFTSPLLMKIKLGEYTLNKFENMLDKILDKLMGKKEWVKKIRKEKTEKARGKINMKSLVKFQNEKY